MKLAGITRVRNEEDILQNTLDHVAQFVDEIYVYDDASEDNTVEICENHPAVVDVIRNRTTWSTNTKERALAEGYMRQAPTLAAVKGGAEWIYCFDADEYIEGLSRKMLFGIGSYAFRLFDFYITPEDQDKTYLDRQWMGPEYRDIPMLFRVLPTLKFTQRIPRGFAGPPVFGGFVKHYGKAISVEEWERKCDYYSLYRWPDRRGDLAARWLDRKGKAVHTESDFGRPLIQWKDRNNKEVIVKL